MLLYLLITSGIWTLTLASISLGDYQPVDCLTNTPWIPGSGKQIRILLESIIKPAMSAELAKAVFETDISRIISIRQNADNLLRWRKFGLQKNDGWLYGSVNEDGPGEDVYYLYSNLLTSIKGNFVNGTMTSGREVKVTHYRCHEEFLELLFSEPLIGSPIYHYEKPTEKQLTSRPTLMDPLDRFNVYVGPSTLGGDTGDGLFARRRIKSGEPICIFAGAVLHRSKQALISFPNMTLGDREERHKNLMTLGKYFIDVPEDDIVKFRASLGHKAQHSFRPNAIFRGMKTPRFGNHMCVEALEDIEEGDEIFSDYHYTNFKDGLVPGWYRELFAREYPNRAHEAYPNEL